MELSQNATQARMRPQHDRLNPSAGNTDAEETARVRAAVAAAGDELRRRHRWLRHQDAIGLGILLMSVAGMGTCAWLYAQGVLPAWGCVPLVAVFASLIHELEHDLIHYMYFRNRPVMHNLMLAVGWLARPSTINPWIRRHIHLHHHKHSGTRTDVEERGITNGEPWGVRRLLMIGDGMLSVLFGALAKPDLGRGLRTVLRGLAAYFPVGWFHFAVWYWFLAFHAADGLGGLLGAPVAWSETTLARMQVVDFLTVVLVGPNVLRSFCLHFVSSNMHYYGDVEDRNIMQQTQVWNRWWLLPFHLFCFNFGSTHAIHHFYVKDPFYVRQWTARRAHAVMQEVGVRFNDFDTFYRANRYRRHPG
jgi:fatty acid desaturase